ncbi:MAG: isocitrate lyase/phosphoenolpyruvate mutase family protein [Chitinophagaceae bacterium]
MTDYEKLYQLHHGDKPFILANAWNAKSAQLIEKAGFAAIGTSSGAIAESLGYPDGEKIPFPELLYMVGRIKASTHLPLSVDFERGYTDDLDTLCAHIQQLIDTGVAGINLEDAQGETIYLEKLSFIKNYLLKTNQQLFINARTDGFLQKLEQPLALTIQRAQRYQAAGADGLFVTAIPDAATLRQITAATTLPVNVVATPALYTMDELAACGVKRISMAVLLYKNTYRQLERTTLRITTDDSLAALYE